MARDDVLILDAGDTTAYARHMRDLPTHHLDQHSPAALRRAAQLLRMAVYLADQAARRCLAAAARLEQPEDHR